MITLYLMEGDYLNTIEELERDGSEYGVTAVYEVNISDWEYQNEMGNTVDRVIKDNFYRGIKLPAGYIKL